MVKIIRKPIKYKIPKRQQFRCQICGCVFETSEINMFKTGYVKWINYTERKIFLRIRCVNEDCENTVENKIDFDNAEKVGAEE